MRVLMFGWEFPPYVSGGLGAACEGMVRALTSRGTEVVFVIPKLRAGLGAGQPKGLTMRGASGTVLSGPAGKVTSVIENTSSYWRRNLRIESVDSCLVPYCSPEFYAQMRESIVKSEQTSTEERTVTIPGTGDKVITLEGGYGRDLMSEVYRYSLAAQKLAMTEDFDVIHCHDWMTYPAGILAKKLTGKPLVCHVHATEADRSGTNMNSVVSHMEWEGLTAADKVVAVSHFTKDLIMRVYQIPEEKIEVVHNAVSRSEAESAYHSMERGSKAKQVLFMGRVTFQKGPDYFVEAARLVHNVMPDVRFVMAGSGDMLRAMVARVAKYRLGHRFTFTGFLKKGEVDRMYASSDLYVMPSVSEPFGIAPLEAMVYDVPVLMSKQSGVSEVIANALKVDFWDVRKMADRICAVLAYPALGRLMVRNCANELKNIRWENAAAKLERVYAALAARGN